MYPYQNTELTPAERAENLMKRMTIEQKIAQLQCIMTFGNELDPSKVPDGIGEATLMLYGMTKEQQAHALRRSAKAAGENSYGVPPILHTETLTGITVTPEGETFPSAIGLGAGFDTELVEHAARVIHDQARAMGYRQALAPVLDVCRDPRWGRIGETYGEDPTLNAMIGTAYVKGIQGEGKDKIAATGKHFLGYGASEGGLNMASSPASMTEIREIYAKPFQAAVTEGGMMSVMNSYGTVDGEMVIGSEYILTELLRSEMEFDGIVVSDYTSIEHLVDHRLAKDMKDAGRQALKAGLDVECPNPNGYSTINIKEGLKNSEISMELLDRSLKRVLETKIRLGMLDGEEETDRFESFGDPENRRINLRAAHESVVLVKNNGILPLEKKQQKIAVIGPHADSIRLLFGCYTYVSGLDMMIGGSLADQAGMETSVEELADATMKVKETEKYPSSNVELESPGALEAIAASYPYTKTILQSIKDKAPQAETVYVKGCDIAGNDRSRFKDAEKLAQSSDIVIVTVGGKYGWGGSCTVGEGIDSDTIGLTGVQEELVLRLISMGRPVIVIHMDARPLCSAAIAEKADAVLETWFPGSTGGEAVADILFGDYNPAGRLPVTVPRSVGQIPVYNGQYTGNGYHSRKTPSVACRYVDSDVEPLYYFGHGLSYTEFSYSNLSTDQEEISSDGSVTISCNVKNTGNRDGEEVVQLYVSDVLASKLRPYQEFAGCVRIALKAGEEKKVRFTVRADQFAFIGKDGKWIVEEGEMRVLAGGSSAELPLQGTFRIRDTAYVRPAKRGFYASVHVEPMTKTDK